MAMVVNQNLGATTAHHYLKMSENSFSKSVERLSSGMKINRAADDPAGLVISEKYRAQVDGLKQAVKNAQDGISLVQTAEGALEEVNLVLRNMRNLALHAASTGTSDTDAIQADQEQMSKAIETLNRVANTTQFGTRKLLDGTSGVSGTSSDPDVAFVSGSTATKSGTYAINITAAAVRGEVRSAVGRTYGAREGGAGNGGTVAAAETFTISGTKITAPVTYTAVGGESQQDIADWVNNNATLMAEGVRASITGGKLKITSEMGEGINAGEITVTTSTTGGADGMDTVTGIVTGGQDLTSQAADGNTLLHSDETITFTNGTDRYVQVSLTQGQSITSAVTAMQDALTQTGIGITASFDTTTQKFKFTNDDYGSQTAVTNNFTSSLNGGVTNLGIAVAAGTSYTIADGTNGIVDHTAGVNVAGTIGGHAATGSGQFLTGATGTDVEGLKLRVAGGVSGAQGNVTVSQGSLDFQIGAFASQTVTLALGDLRANNLGTSATGTTYMSTVNVASIDLTKGDGSGAQDAIKVIDAAIEQVSGYRAEMGSFQKDVLESSVRNLGVAAQNMASSESVIRDADMAEEMLSFSRAQILQSTGMAMLAQANQAPQSIMRLFG